MVSSKLQNVIIRTMRSDLEFLERGGQPDIVSRSTDETEELLKRAQLAVRQAEAERGFSRPASDKKIKKESAIPDDKIKEEAQRKAEEERKRQEEAQRKAEEERKRQEEAQRKAEEERKRQEEAQKEKERLKWEKILTEAEEIAKTKAFFLPEEEETLGRLIAQKEQEIVSLQTESHELPTQKKSILPKKKRLSDQKNQLEKEYQNISNQLESIKQQREKIEQAEINARTNEERRKYEEQRWQLANKQREAEQEKWNKKDELSQVSTKLNHLESQSDEIQSHQEEYRRKIEKLNQEKEEIELRKEAIGLRQRLTEIDLSKSEPFGQLQELEVQKENLREELRPVLTKERSVENLETELKKQIEGITDPEEKKKMTEKRWQIEKEREDIEKERWQIEQKVITLRNKQKEVSAPYQALLDEERRLAQRLKEVETLIVFGLEKGRQRLETITQKQINLREQKLKGPYSLRKQKPEKEKPALETKEDSSLPSSGFKSPIREDQDELARKETKDRSKQTSNEVNFQESDRPKEQIPEITPPNRKTTDIPPKEVSLNENLEKKKQEAREKLTEEMKARKTEMENKQAAIEEKRQTSVPAPKEIETKKPLAEEEKSSPNPATARETFVEQLMASSSHEEAEREKFLRRVRGEDNSSLPPDPLEARLQEGVIFRPVPQSPDRSQKIVARILIVLLIIGLGVLAYLVIKGYLL